MQIVRQNDRCGTLYYIKKKNTTLRASRPFYVSSTPHDYPQVRDLSSFFIDPVVGLKLMRAEHLYQTEYKRQLSHSISLCPGERNISDLDRRKQNRETKKDRQTGQTLINDRQDEVVKK